MLYKGFANVSDKAGSHFLLFFPSAYSFIFTCSIHLHLSLWHRKFWWHGLGMPCVSLSLLDLLALNFLLKTSLKERSPNALEYAPKLAYDLTVFTNSQWAWEKSKHLVIIHAHGSESLLVFRWTLPAAFFFFFFLMVSGRRDQQNTQRLQRWGRKWGKFMPFPKPQIGSRDLFPLVPPPIFGHVPVAPRAMEKKGAAQNCHIWIQVSGAIYLNTTHVPTRHQASCSDNSQEIRNMPWVPVTFYIPNFAQWLMVPSSKWHIDCGYT